MINEEADEPSHPARIECSENTPLPMSRLPPYSDERSYTREVKEDKEHEAKAYEWRERR